jgi:hypothetical protein
MALGMRQLGIYSPYGNVKRRLRLDKGVKLSVVAGNYEPKSGAALERAGRAILRPRVLAAIFGGSGAAYLVTITLLAVPISSSSDLGRSSWGRSSDS